MERTWSSAARLSTDVSDTWGGPGTPGWQSASTISPTPEVAASQRRTGFLTFKLLGFVTLGMLLGLSAIIYGQNRKPREAMGPFPEPIQQIVWPTLELPALKGYKIVATDEFSVEGMIMARQRYRTGRESDLSPIDFIMAWGEVVMEPNLSAIKWTQGGRFGYYRYEDARQLSVPPSTIVKLASNMHMIPDSQNSAIRGELLSLQQGECVRISGYLVKISAPDGWQWNSSRSRSDSGKGACEVIYVTSVERL